MSEEYHGTITAYMPDKSQEVFRATPQAPYSTFLSNIDKQLLSDGTRDPDHQTRHFHFIPKIRTFTQAVYYSEEEKLCWQTLPFHPTYHPSTPLRWRMVRDVYTELFVRSLEASDCRLRQQKFMPAAYYVTQCSIVLIHSITAIRDHADKWNANKWSDPCHNLRISTMYHLAHLINHLLLQLVTDTRYDGIQHWLALYPGNKGGKKSLRYALTQWIKIPRYAPRKFCQGPDGFLDEIRILLQQAIFDYVADKLEPDKAYLDAILAKEEMEEEEEEKEEEDEVAREKEEEWEYRQEKQKKRRRMEDSFGPRSDKRRVLVPCPAYMDILEAWKDLPARTWEEKIEAWVRESAWTSVGPGPIEWETTMPDDECMLAPDDAMIE
jgi:hypothetical protein